VGGVVERVGDGGGGGWGEAELMKIPQHASRFAA